MKCTNDAKFDASGFSYDPETGWIFKDGRRRDFNNGLYRGVQRKGVYVTAHRLAWRLHNGQWPPVDREIDHRNLNKHDNRIWNFRLATRNQNCAHGNAYKSCQSGERGVYWHKSKKQWCVRLRSYPRSFCFSASHKISAILAARLIRRELHGEFAA